MIGIYKYGSKFRVYVRTSEKLKYIGTCDKKIEAAKLYDVAAIYFLDNPKLNYPKKIDEYKRNPYNPRSLNRKNGKYVGVSWHSSKNKWVAYININKKRIHLGYFKDDIAAAEAYDRAAVKHRGKEAKVNFP